jgi:hypothetical protein
MFGFVCAHSPCWLGNHKRKVSRCQLRKHQRDCLHSWSLDSSAHTVLVDLKIVSESLVATDSETINDIASTAIAWIHHLTKSMLTPNRKRKQSRCRLRNHQRDCLPSWSLDSSAHTVPVDSGNITESWVAADSETLNNSAPSLMRWFVRAQSRGCLGNRKRKMSRCQLRRHQRHCLHCWSLVSSAHTILVDSKIISES